MKYALILVGFLISISGSLYASSLNMDPNGPTDEQALAAWGQFPFSIRHFTAGINKGYIGVTACQVGTGVPFYALSEEVVASSTFESCLHIPTYTEKTASYLLSKYPAGSKVGNVFITVEYEGVPVPQ